MANTRNCKERNARGEPCRGTPMRESSFCVFHDPEHAEVVLEARRAGGQRRKREATLATAYDFQGRTSIPEIRRLIEVAAFDALGLENSIHRVRALAYLAQVSATLLEKGEVEERLQPSRTPSHPGFSRKENADAPQLPPPASLGQAGRCSVLAGDRRRCRPHWR
jgi:hypothetical protein